MGRKVGIAAIINTIIGLVFNLTVPGLVGGSIAVIISSAARLDPLYSGGRNEAVWQTLTFFLVIQTIQSIIISPGTALLIAPAVSRVKKGRLYFTAVVIAGALQVLTVPILVWFTRSFFQEANTTAIGVVSFFIAATMGPILGITDVYIFQQGE